MKYFLLIACLLSCFTMQAQEQNDNKVLLLPALHRLHLTNKNYSYDSLQRVIRRFHPDIIAIEMRPEDLKMDTFYLQKNYPYEMIMMRYWFPKTDIIGIDWVGNDIEGQRIPPNYWKEISMIKQYERTLQQDTVYARKCKACDSLNTERMLLLQSLSLKQLLRSNDSMLTTRYYECMADQLRGSIHERMLDFYDERNGEILKNVKTILRQHKKKRIVILTGDDHYIFLKPYLTTESL